MTLTFYRYGSTDTIDELELDETKSSIIDKLNEPSRLSAILTSETAPQIALGNYTTYKGTRYYVTKEPTVRKEHSQLYTVEVDLERSLGLGRITILANPVDHRTTFDFTGTATEHLQLIVDCLNAKYEEVELKWTRGAVHCKDTIKHIKYDGATVLGALQQIRETYETDIFADGETLSLGQEDDKTTALPLAYGKGKGLLSGLERHKHTDDTVPTRLYVTGTKRNMAKGRLTLEKDVILSVDLKSGAIERVTGGVPTAGGRSYYRTDPTGQYIAEWSSTDKFFQSGRRFPTEATYTNEEIYPSHVSTIKSVTKVKDHYEVNSDFNYDKFRIEGEQMQVVFQTGNLAGRDFDAKYYPSTGRLAIVPKEEDDTTLPSDILCPKVGDQYIVTGIKLPDEYIREAERNLTDEALRHLIKLQETRYSYKADIDPVYLHNSHDTIAPQLAVGRYVRLTDPQIAIGDPYVRIVGKRTYLDRPYTPEIELSNEVEPRSELTRVLNDLDRQDEGLASILERLRQSGLVLSDLTLSSDAMRQRVEAAEEALTGKLDSGDFSTWRTGELAKALASKQPVGSYVDPSQLATSQQQTLAEAVRQAGEMDKKIKVGGRNLIVTSRWKAGYLYGDLSGGVAGEEYYKVLRYKSFRFDPVYIPTLGERNVTYKLYDNGGRTDGNVQIHAYDKDKKFLWWSYDNWVGTVGRTVTWTLPAETAYIRLGAVNENVRAKVEFGTVATDWTPAPEDVEESVSTVNTSLTSLASTLLDPEQGEIHKLTSQLESHKTATDKSFEDIATHPLTVDDNGFWKIWSVKDNKYVTTQYQSRGRDGQDGRNGSDGADGKDGHTPRIDWDGTKLIIENMAPVDLRGEAGHTPAPEDVLHAQGFQEMLDGAVWDEVKPVRDDLSTANTNIADLSNRSLTLQQKEDLVDITDSLQVLRSGSNNTLEGLALQRIIALSGDGANVSAYLASNALPAVLKAGITNFGTPQEREEVAINHNGTGHLGNLYFAGNQIDFRTDEHTDPYLSIGAEESQFIGDFLRTARVDQQVVYASSVTLTTSTTSYERTVDVANDGTRLTVTIDSIKIETYGSAKTRLTLDGEVLAEWRGKEYKNHGGSLTGGDIEITQEPYTASDLSYERVVKAGRHAIRLEIVQPTDGATANIKELRVRRRYDTGVQQSLLTKSGLRLFGAPDRYLDVDYRTTYRAELGNGRFYYYHNDYLVRIKGGAKVDKLTADELDMPGVPLCGASFDANGGQIKAFGKYVNQQGTSRAQAVYYDSGRFFRVYHSIGHTNYLPTVQVIGDNGNDINWNLTARIYAVNANDFAVRIITNGDNPIRHAFSFVAFKTL